MHAAVVRSGLVEARHPVSIVVAGREGATLLEIGDVDRTFYLRSAAKPLQAHVSSEHGADLTPEQLALACASHSGWPVHLAIVEGMLAEAGLDESALRCPLDHPLGAEARDLHARLVGLPTRLAHNCSGKHAAMLRACLAQGWPLDYIPATHPLQAASIALADEVTGGRSMPVGVDGCGVPTLRVDTRGMARMYGRLTDLDTRVADAMMRFPALTSGSERAEALIATWYPAVVKVGAQGCMGFGTLDGIGIAVKCWTGSSEVAAAGIVEAARRIGLLPPHVSEMLDSVAHPVVLGGGEVVGRIEWRDS